MGSNQTFGEILPRLAGEAEAEKTLRDARMQANARAMILLAARECPSDIVEWGRVHGIPTFAEFTWQAGFAAGMRAAALPVEKDAP